VNEFILNAETSIIGGLLLFPDECQEAIDTLSPNDFVSEYAATIFQTIVTATKNGGKVDAAIFSSKGSVSNYV